MLQGSPEMHASFWLELNGLIFVVVVVVVKKTKKQKTNTVGVYQEAEALPPTPQTFSRNRLI